MSAPSHPLDTLLRLGEQIAGAVEAEEWDRLSGLVERRSQVAQRLRDLGEEGAHEKLSPEEREEKREALADQHQRLTALLREQRNQIEEELAQVEEIRQAQDSYESSPGPGGVLPPGLSG